MAGVQIVGCANYIQRFKSVSWVYCTIKTRLVHGLLFLSHSMETCDCPSHGIPAKLVIESNFFISWACLRFSFCRAVVKTFQNFHLGDKIKNGLPLLSCHQKQGPSTLLLGRTVARKSSIRVFTFVQGPWHSNLTKIPLTYSVSHFNLRGLGLCLWG